MQILIIDDDPDRYDGLTRMLEDRAAKGHPVPVLRITCVRSEIEAWLPFATAVLLDYDLDMGGVHHPAPEYKKSTAYLPLILARVGVPVIVVSSNYDGGRLLNQMLAQAQKQPNTLIRANEVCPEIQWLGWLYQHGVL